MPPDFAYADADQVVREAFAAFLPASRVSVAEHAARHRWLKSPTGAHLERFDHRTAPYLREPMEALTADEHLAVCLVGPGQCGKTVVAENWLLHSIDTDPADLLWYMQTDPGVQSYVKGRIEPMLDQHEGLIGGRRHGQDSIAFKRFTGMRAEFLSFTSSNLINKSAARIVADEVDAYDETLGDAKALLDVRRQAAGMDSRLLALSHPDRATGMNPALDWQRGIMAIYAQSDRRTWWWRCPHCGAYSSPNPGASRQMVLHYPETGALAEIEAAARLLCPVNGCLIDDAERRAMLATGRWVAAGETCDQDGRIHGQRQRHATAGFWIVGVMSPFVLGGIGALARARVAAERELEVTGEDASLRTVMVKGWGHVYTPPRQVGMVEAAVLAERARPDLVLGRVPEGARVLTAAADVQGNRFELLVRGWGPGLESWVVDHRVLPADPAHSLEDWDALLRFLARAEYPLADGSGRVMRLRGAVFDSAGGPGVTEQAYAAWIRARRAALVRRLGQVDGRDAWSVTPAKGASEAKAPRLVLAYPDSARKDRKAGARGQVPVLFFNPNLAKDALAAQLSRAEPGPNAVHIPAALRGAAGESGPFFEQLSAERRDRRGRWDKAAPHLRNEAIDLMVMTEVAARLHGLHRLAWETPPAWAAPWDANPLVGAPAEPAAAAFRPAGGEAAAASSAPPATPTTPTLPEAAPQGAPIGVVVAAAAAGRQGLGTRLARRLA